MAGPVERRVETPGGSWTVRGRHPVGGADTSRSGRPEPHRLGVVADGPDRPVWRVAVTDLPVGLPQAVAFLAGGEQAGAQSSGERRAAVGARAAALVPVHLMLGQVPHAGIHRGGTAA